MILNNVKEIFSLMTSIKVSIFKFFLLQTTCPAPREQSSMWQRNLGVGDG